MLQPTQISSLCSRWSLKCIEQYLHAPLCYFDPAHRRKVVRTERPEASSDFIRRPRLLRMLELPVRATCVEIMSLCLAFPMIPSKDKATSLDFAIAPDRCVLRALFCSRPAMLPLQECKVLASSEPDRASKDGWRQSRKEKTSWVKLVPRQKHLWYYCCAVQAREVADVYYMCRVDTQLVIE